MKLIRFYKRTRFFLLINITGLAIGFSVSIMLLLFVINELSYDKHFANRDRIIRLCSIFDDYTVAINLRSAYTELPSKVPGIDYAVQMFSDGVFDVAVEQNIFKRVNLLFTDPEFFKVFRMKFIDGTPENALKEPNSVVITRRYAEIMFGNATNAMDNQISVRGRNLTVSGIVEQLPVNTHFTFDMLTNIPESYIEMLGGCEYNTYYLINKESSLETVRKNIETEYTALMKSRFNNRNCGGLTEKLTDVYLHSTIRSNLTKSSSISRIQTLALIAVFILLLAIANFVNLFITHGESRMKEIGIRKANGAGIWDIVKQFLSEISVIVFIAFVTGFVLSIYITPYFSQLIGVEISLTRLMSPDFIICGALLFILTVVLSAGYPAFYISRFSPLDILFKRIKFSKRRLTSGVVIFQTIITLVLMSYIYTMNRQTQYLENYDKGYVAENVVGIMLSRSLYENYDALKQELKQLPFIQQISGSDHFIGGGCSGQSIASLEDNTTATYSINEYRIMPDMCELMGFQLVDGNFLREEDRRDTLRAILLNETAVKLLGMERPVAGKYVNYKGDVNTKIIGVVKDFYYDSPGNEIKPLAISFCFRDIGSLMYLRFDKNVNRKTIRESVNSVFGKFDPDFFEPVWDEDIYAKKFESLKTQSTIILLSTLLSLLIVILGLFAIHLYTTIRRTKEISIRRIYGADHRTIFMLLSSDILKWIGIAAIIAIPIEYYIVSYWLAGYANRIPLSAGIFLFPILVQCIIALSISFGLTVRTLSQNPVNSLRS